MVILARGDGAAVGIDDDRRAAVLRHRVSADAVDADDVTLVLDGPRTQQRAPGFDAADGPTGHVEGHVVIAAVAAPDGEAQVVADLQQDAYAAEGDDHATRAACVVTVLAAVGEEVALVVRLHAAVGVDEAEAVVVTTAIFHGQRSGHSRAACRRLTHHPAERLAVGLFGHAFGMRRETGGEHLRQHVEVGARPTVDGRLRLPHVLRRIGPGNVLLQNNDSHGYRLHSAPSFVSLTTNPRAESSLRMRSLVAQSLFCLAC